MRASETHDMDESRAAPSAGSGATGSSIGARFAWGRPADGGRPPGAGRASRRRCRGPARRPRDGVGRPPPTDRGPGHRHRPGGAVEPGAQRLPLLGPGIRFTSRTVLQVAVVVLGTQLSLRQVAEVGVSSLPVMIGTLVICLAAAYELGRALKVDADLRTLIGVGTGICGASAIAAVTPIIRREEATMSYAVSTIFC